MYWIDNKGLWQIHIRTRKCYYGTPEELDWFVKEEKVITRRKQTKISWNGQVVWGVQGSRVKVENGIVIETRVKERFIST